jgi:hypothetical protein
LAGSFYIHFWPKIGQRRCVTTPARPDDLIIHGRKMRLGCMTWHAETLSDACICVLNVFGICSVSWADWNALTVAKWVLKAEKLGGLPKLVGGVFHPYRRLWATERKNLPDVDVATAGGWKDTQALRLSYQHADPAGVLAAVNAG